MHYSMDKIVSLSKRRGFIFPSSQIYGGFSSCYDYGPLGVELKNNIKREWWRSMVWSRPDVVGLDAAILMSPKVWEASGHLSAGFTDPLRECTQCHKRFRGDTVGERCPECGGILGEERKFNLMMKTYAGAVEDTSTTTYLRPETAQGIYVNFPNVLDTSRMKIPFGIAQIGKAFRNEITPGNFIFRTREFEQMEMQFFIKPNTAKKRGTRRPAARATWGAKDWFAYWKQERMQWYVGLGIRKENVRFRKHKKTELAHYAKAAEDIEYRYPFGWGELEGIHDRGTWDLTSHAKLSGADLRYFDEATNTRYIPQIVETSAGADRSTLVFILNAYHEEKVRGEERVVLKFHPRISPIKVAVLPLVRNKSKLVSLAKRVYKELLPHFTTMYDEVGSIGRRYRRQDEAGTPWAITIDFESLSRYDVTLRDRDSMKQTRLKIDDLLSTLKSKLGERT